MNGTVYAIKALVFEIYTIDITDEATREKCKDIHYFYTYGEAVEALLAYMDISIRLAQSNIYQLQDKIDDITKKREVLLK